MTDWCVYSVSGTNIWQYFAGLQQDVILCRCTHLFSATPSTAHFPISQIKLAGIIFCLCTYLNFLNSMTNMATDCVQIEVRLCTVCYLPQEDGEKSLSL
jgi:hypothetical protein